MPSVRLLSQPQARTSESTPLDARNTDRNPNVWHAKLVLATTGLHLAQFRHKYRPLAKTDYAELFIYDEAQQEASLSDLERRTDAVLSLGLLGEPGSLPESL